MRIPGFVVPALAWVMLASPARAELVDLTLTFTYSNTDFFLDPTSTTPPTGVPQENDGKVFGVAPSNGSTTFTLRVDTTAAAFFPTGHLSNGTAMLVHDWYGYSNVQLLCAHTFGTATWNFDDLATALVGPDDATATLWTNADIATANPTLLSFRMQGLGDGIIADLFLGSRALTPTTLEIRHDGLLAEYFAGESIFRDTNGYSAVASIVVVPEPGTGLLALIALVGATLRSRRL
jgi:hypothetical protein